MVWNSVETLPLWWEPFHHAWVMIPAVIILPPLFAFVLAYVNFRNRVSGVYFTIVTLSVSAIMAIVIIGQQGYTGGIKRDHRFQKHLLALTWIATKLNI